MLVGQHWYIHVQESIRKHQLWVCPCFSSNGPCLVCLTWMIYELKGKWPYCCSFVGGCFYQFKRVFLCSSHLAFSLCILLVSMWCIHIVVWTQLQLGSNPFFSFLDRPDLHMINNPSIAFHAFIKRILTPILWMRCCFRGLWTSPLILEDGSFLFKTHVLCFIFICHSFCGISASCIF